ncbi:hypothetical protein SAMN05216223_11251 [Actinacidiphila yanglinensis]|uniref:Uncharacterized protein n=1 Tax=Actinacidiphila yanglinensis TaxID=310779 RepID=A0A1H6D639_9ACTN|nr:hypothetical protein [Actinacidiphila yanglinensis]SEG80544.1 hypothetical protein SAMN05216223_11251 [Actinacidiphila yanglinensis]
MYTSDLTREVLADLRAPRTYPAITLAMPTDPHAPFGESDRILLGDLLTQARRRLADDPDVARDTRLELRDRKLVPEVIEDAGGPFHPGDALVVYAAAGEPVQVWQLTSPPVAPRVEFGTSFLTRYQVAAEQRAQPYLVLVLDQEMCRLHLGSAGALTEIRGHGFPDAPQIPSPEDSLPGPIPHAAPYEDHGERIRQYLKTVDARLDEVLRDHAGRPVFVIGSGKMLSAFTDLTRHGDVIAGTLPLTGMDTRPPADLADRLEPLLVGFRARQVGGAVADLDAARARGTYAGGAPEVWTAVADQRVRRLVVEDDLVVAGRVGADGRDLDVVPFPQPVTLPAPGWDQGPSPRAAGVATDIVEQLVENAILADSRVQFVPEGTLPDCGAGAVLRY